MAERAPEPKAEEPRREIRERLEFAYRSLPSERHPSYTEDAHLEDPELGVYGVFDGVGGHFGGKEASAAAAEAVSEEIRTTWEDITDDEADDTRLALANVFLAAQRAVVDRGQEIYRSEYLKLPAKDRPEWRSPQTTATVAKLYEFQDGRVKAYIAHIGDCRAYVRRADGTLEQITQEDDVLNDRRELKFLLSHFHTSLTEEDIARYRRLMDEADGEMAMPDELGKYLFQTRNQVAKTLGHDYGSQPMGVQSYAVDIQPGDTVLLMSDGVHDNLKQSRIQELAAQVSDPDALVERLSSEAYEFGHLAKKRASSEEPMARNKRDDITVMAIRVKSRA